MQSSRAALDHLFYPRGVAIVGSATQSKLGYELVRQVRDGGYGGPEGEGLYIVNPGAESALGIVGYDSVASIAEPVDLAVVASPPSTVLAVLEDCGRAGVGAVAIITAGFSEIGEDAAEREVVDVARQNGVRFVGPNCAGIVNTAHALYPSLETRPPAGHVAVVAQSGAIGGIVLAWAKQYGLGISKFVSYGNGADLNEIDLLDYLADDADTAVIALYIESVADGRLFMDTLDACTERKPVVVIKAGRTEAGQRATLSHTGSMAGADRVYDAALRQCGALRVRSVEELFDACKAFVHLPEGIGQRVAIVTNSGGPGVLAADRAEEVGLDVGQPGASVRERLGAFLPGHCALQNPIDLTVQGTGDWYRDALLAVLEEYDAALAINVSTPYLDSVALARGVVHAAEQVADGFHSPRAVMAAFLPEQVVGESVPYLEDHGVPSFATGERAVTALGLVSRYWRGEVPTASPGEDGGGVRSLPEDRPILEPDAMAWLSDNGIPVPPFRHARSAGQAVEAARDMGYPVAMKIVSAQILHKSDAGGVLLNVRSDEEAVDAFEQLREVGLDRDFRGAVVYPMITDAREVLVGLSHDPQFGPIVAFGLGGIYTEVLQDVALRVAPIGREAAQEMVREISSFPMLKGLRGELPRDIEALAALLARVSELPVGCPDLRELDLNPVFLFEEGRGLVVGDVRVITTCQAKE